MLVRNDSAVAWKHNDINGIWDRNTKDNKLTDVVRFDTQLQSGSYYIVKSIKFKK